MDICCEDGRGRVSRSHPGVRVQVPWDQDDVHTKMADDDDLRHVIMRYTHTHQCFYLILTGTPEKWLVNLLIRVSAV